MLLADCCENPSFTCDPRSKKKYCKIHFTELIEKRIRKTINLYKMMKRNDHIGVGYSGGKDSTMLLHILSKMKKQYPNCEITALTIDEGIKGYRDGCLKLTQEIVKKYDIDHIIVSFKQVYGATLDEIVVESNEKNHRLSPCALCGILRRRALNYAARKVDVTIIATAHNLDDEAQSILMNMLRGDSRKFIRHSRKPINKFIDLKPRIRPLVRISEPEIALYTFANNLEYHSVPCPYSSSAMRNDIREFLSEMEQKRPSTLINIINLHDSLRKYFQNIPNLESTFTCIKCGEVSTHKVCPVCQLLVKFEPLNLSEL
ncbi:MAG: TIGR00269 family protein [Candidatus Hodarchaeota archaeon]